MAKRKSARLLALDFVDRVMERTVAAHLSLCDEGKCNLEAPCAYCQIGEILMEEVAKIK
jgi:hypothetical protein